MKKILMYLSILLTIQNLTAFAVQYDINRKTPEIEEALEGRKARYQKLRSFKEKGELGENNQGYVEARDQAPELQQLAKQENSDRRVIYNAIADQNGLGSVGIPHVESAFADVQRDKAKEGEEIQMPSGEWKKK